MKKEKKRTKNAKLGKRTEANQQSDIHYSNFNILKFVMKQAYVTLPNY